MASAPPIYLVRPLFTPQEELNNNTPKTCGSCMQKQTPIWREIGEKHKEQWGEGWERTVLW